MTTGYLTVRGRLPQLFDAFEAVLDAEREHLPLWIPVGVGAGIVAWQFTGDRGFTGVICVSAALALFAFVAGRVSRVSSVLAGASATLLAGFVAIAFKSALVGAPPLPKVRVGDLYGRIERVEILSARDTVRLYLETGKHQGLPEKIRINLQTEQYHPDFRSGAIVKLRARLMPPAGPALPGGYDFARRAWFEGIGATGSALGPVVLHRASPGDEPFSGLRMKLSQHIREQMTAQSAGIGVALVTGDQGQISDADAQAMRDSGLAHLLSISGLHVTAVVGFIFLFFSRLLALFPWLALRIRVPVAAAAFAAVGAIAYTLLAGAEVPTVRSCIAALLVLAALVLGRDALTLRLVAFGALVVLLFWPEALAGPSFQLSFAAISTIVVLHELPLIKRWTARREEALRYRLIRGLLSLVLTGIAIELMLAPIAIYHFHKTGLYGALANVVAIPMTTFFIMPMEAFALLFDVFGLGEPFWWAAGHGISAILTIAHRVSGMPGAVSMLPSMPGWAFAFMICGMLIFGLFQSKIRLAGVAPFIIGVAAMVAAPRPDLLVTGEGRHLALVRPSGEISLLRSGAGEYIQDMLLESAGTTARPTEIEDWPGTTCSPDNCVFDIEREGRRWSVLATRTRYHVPSMQMAAACRRVDIVVSDRWLPASCVPRWLKADRSLLEQSGGLAFYLPDMRIDSVNAGRAQMPWAPEPAALQ